MTVSNHDISTIAMELRRTVVDGILPPQANSPQMQAERDRVISIASRAEVNPSLKSLGDLSLLCGEIMCMKWRDVTPKTEVRAKFERIRLTIQKMLESSKPLIC